MPQRRILQQLITDTQTSGQLHYLATKNCDGTQVKKYKLLYSLTTKHTICHSNDQITTYKEQRYKCHGNTHEWRSSEC